MAENLRVSRYNNGCEIDQNGWEERDEWEDEPDWDIIKKGSWCNYKCNPDYDIEYGKLYNFEAIEDDRGLAPKGWHIPSYHEWKRLIDYLGGEQIACNKLKEKGVKHWKDTNKNITNESGFNALAGGYRYDTNLFVGLGEIATWWTSDCENTTQAWSVTINNYNNGVSIDLIDDDMVGCSVRCIKDIESEPLTDIDDNIYETVQIGSQIWMAENLRVSRYRNGDLIPNEIDNSDWCFIKTGACCSYENNPDYDYEYGKLYNWYAADDKRNLAPDGWHIPSEEDWQILIDYLGGVEIAGGVLKDTRIWDKPNLGATDDYGFSAVPLGIRHYEDGKDLANGRWSAFWSVTSKNDNEGFGILLDSNTIDLSAGPTNKNYGFSVRCVKDSNNQTI